LVKAGRTHSEETAATVASTEKREVGTEILLDKISRESEAAAAGYSESALAELTESIRKRGVLQPILVTPAADGTYEIIAGERRWRAAQRADSNRSRRGQSAPEIERFQMALIENIQREI